MTIKQTHEILKIIKTQSNITILTNIGKDYLLPEELSLLKRSGINVEKVIGGSRDVIRDMYYFGLISDMLGKKGKSVTFSELKKHVKAREHIPLTIREKVSIESIKKQYLGDIRAHEGRIFKDINGIINQGEENNRSAYERVIRDEVERGIKEKKISSEIARDISRKTGDWSRDFNRIVGYMSHKAFDEGRAALYERKGGGDVLVYKDVYAGACSTCIKAYLTAGIGSKPIVFKLSEIRANGTNIGKKKIDWKPVIASMHPNCRCTLNEVPEGYKWNEETKAFDIAVRTKEQKAKRKPIKVSFGGKEYSV